MNFYSSLADNLKPQILDTSVLINLNASTVGDRILRDIPNEFLVSRIVAQELEHETSRQNGDCVFLENLIADKTVMLTSMTDEEFSLFAKLTSGPSSLDDGEASTIAISTTRNISCVIDEKRGRSQATGLMNGQAPSWSLELFRHEAVVGSLSSASAANALYLALRDGRMRISKDHCDYVVDLIGVQRALDCTSLPGYKVRRAEWLESNGA